jgi:hypothetical protein
MVRIQADWLSALMAPFMALQNKAEQPALVRYSE